MTIQWLAQDIDVPTLPGPGDLPMPEIAPPLPEPKPPPPKEKKGKAGVFLLGALVVTMVVIVGVSS